MRYARKNTDMHTLSCIGRGRMNGGKSSSCCLLQEDILYRHTFLRTHKKHVCQMKNKF